MRWTRFPPKDIVHRDTKPANILRPNVAAKVLDFGLAKMTASSPRWVLSLICRLNRCGQGIGRPN